MTTKQDIKKLGTILGLWAHPDDEAFTSAGIMKTAVDNGQRVIIVTATKGDAGQTADESRWSQNNLAKIRELEQKACLDCIGVTDTIWLDYKDGKLKKADDNEATKTIQSIIDTEDVDTILTFAEDGVTGHDDHKTVCQWARNAARISSNQPDVYGAKLVCKTSDERAQMAEYDKKFNMFFNTDEPHIITPSEADLYLELDKGLLDCKIQCLRAHASQTDQMFRQADGEKMMRNIAATEAFIKI